MLLTMVILVIDDSYFEPSAHIFTKKTTILPTLIIFHRIVFIKTCIKVKAAAGNRLVFRKKTQHSYQQDDKGKEHRYTCR